MKWREEIMRVVEQATFLPESINGKARELDWLRNMGDWMISKKRYWGLALPIWVCESCKRFDVIGGRDELRTRAVEGWPQFEGHTPHRPWIDLVKVKCSHCGGKASRVPDVGNPWLDAGIVPYSTMGYNRDRKYWEQWFPADFITESFPGQFRNWFYAILAMSTMMEGRPPFKVLLGHAMVRDERGDEMHKAKGNSIPFEDGAEKMGADLMRWMFCRQNPAQNINFGYGPADELRSKFVLKLWNTYAFFCDNARQTQGGFDLSAPAVPVSERPDIDRWVLSDLQGLVRTARQAFERFDVQAFCLAAEEFVEDKLSNWYVRRNKRPFQDAEPSREKLSAYQTLHTVLVTLTRLFAPIMPFLTEEMYRNLVPGPDGRSVHLCDYAEPDESLIDEQLSADTGALRRLVRLGSAARNTVKIKVRQPLAELKVRPAEESDRRAVERFADQIREELNVKKVTLHEGNGALLSAEVKPNPKALGPKVGPRLKDVVTAIAKANPEQLAAKVRAGEAVELPLPGGESVTVEPADLWVTARAPEGWAGVEEGGTQVVVDARVTDTLKREGMARDVVRQVNQLRKDAALKIEDRIALYLGTESAALRQAIDEHRDYIAAETLTARWATQPLGDGAPTANVKVEGQALTIQLRTV
jgi:isoleucyl-tRNA synthetase